jgi:mRNA interferase MazF
MWKTRPVIVMSYRNTLIGVCTVIPTSTDPQEGFSAEWAHKLSVRFGGVQSWAVCNQPITVAASRLSQFKGDVPRVPEQDFNAILALLLKWLPKLPADTQAGSANS